MSDVFISYSRLDKDFVGNLRDALTNQQQEVWIDWESIPPSQTWWSEIQKGIARSNNFVLIMSPNSMSSPICQMEIEYAQQLGKRLIPVLHLDYKHKREEIVKAIAERLASPDQAVVRQLWGDRQPYILFDRIERILSPIHYFVLRPEDSFTERFSALLDVIRTDYAYKEKHTTLELRALEWARRAGDVSFLLLEMELVEAQAWLAEAKYKQPAPTQLHFDYIRASEKRTRQLRRVRRTAFWGSIIGFLAVIFALAASYMGIRAVDFLNTANTQIAGVQPTLAAGSTQISAISTQVNNAENAAEGNRLAVRAREVFDESLNNPLGLALALNATRLSLTAQTERVLSDLAYSPGARIRLQGHSDEVNDAVFSPDGAFIATTSWDNSAILWDAETGTLLHRLVGHTGFVISAAFSPDSHLVATTSCSRRDGTMTCIEGEALIWNVDLGSVVHRLTRSSGQFGAVFFSPDATQLIIETWGGETEIWDFSTGNLATEIEGSGRLSDIYFGRDSIYALGYGYGEGGASIWDLRTGVVLRTFEGHSLALMDAEFSPDGSKIVTASYDNTAIIWDVASGSILHELHGHTDWVSGASFSVDGLRVVTSSYDSTAIVWDIDTGLALYRLEGHTNGINSAKFNSLGTQVVTASGDDTAIVWDVTPGNIVSIINIGANRVTSASFSPDGNYFVTASCETLLYSQCAEPSLVLRDTTTGNVTMSLQGHSGWVTSTSFSPDGRFLVTSSEDKTANVWDLTEGIIRFQLLGHTSAVNRSRFSADGSQVITASNDGTVIIWDASTGSILHRYEGSNDWVTDVAISPSGTYIAFGSLAGTDNTRPTLGVAVIIDVTTNTIVRRLEENLTGFVTGVDFSPDGLDIATISCSRYANSGCVESDARVWDVATGQILHRLELEGQANSASYSPDGREILISLSDGTAIVWNATLGGKSRVLEVHNAQVNTAAFSSDGTRIITSSDDGSVIIWRFDAMEQLQAWTLANRFVPVLTCAERLTYNAQPFCSETHPETSDTRTPVQSTSTDQGTY